MGQIPIEAGAQITELVQPAGTAGGIVWARGAPYVQFRKKHIDAIIVKKRSTLIEKSGRIIRCSRHASFVLHHIIGNLPIETYTSGGALPFLKCDHFV